MVIPYELQQATDEALSAMRSHPRHHLVPYYRYRIYEVLKGFNGSQALPKPPRALARDSLGDRVRGWLAINTMEKVLPIFKAATYSPEVDEDDLALPMKLVEMAYGVMKGTTNPQEALHEASALEHEFGMLLNEYEYDPEGFPLNASLVGWTAGEALAETLASYRIDWLLEQKMRWLELDGKPRPSDITSIELLWDESERVGPLLDTAGDAAMAYSCSNSSPVCDPAKLEEFWTWWLTEALPEAWARASGDVQPEFR
jgi:hypothetical protein